jgi:hypothetical protein
VVKTRVDLLIDEETLSVRGCALGKQGLGFIAKARTGLVKIFALGYRGL